MLIILNLSLQNMKQKKETTNECGISRKRLASSQLNNTSDSILQHLFMTKKLTPEQEHDLVNFRDTGQEEFEN